MEKVVNSRVKGGKQQYRVQWEGHNSKGNTWVDESDMEGSSKLVEEYNHKKGTALHMVSRNIVKCVILTVLQLVLAQLMTSGAACAVSDMESKMPVMNTALNHDTLNIDTGGGELR